MAQETRQGSASDRPRANEQIVKVTKTVARPNEIRTWHARPCPYVETSDHAALCTSVYQSALSQSDPRLANARRRITSLMVEQPRETAHLRQLLLIADAVGVVTMARAWRQHGTHS
jgi:hypothetical protein